MLKIGGIDLTGGAEHVENRPIADASVACVLAYSIVMLHTDQHNPQVRRRMTFEDYARNVRGVNDGKDFDVEFLVRNFCLELHILNIKLGSARFSMA